MGKLPHILFFLILLSYSFVKGQKDSITTIYTFVALCDNENQGIYPVSKDLGNGQNPRLNLYWGALYGVKTHFRKSSSDWTYIKSEKVDSIVLERVFFKHKVKNVYLIADAYDGRYIKKCTDDFLKSSWGMKKDSIDCNGIKLGAYGNSKLIAYAGHDGLMEFKMDTDYKAVDSQQRDMIILACVSKTYFKPYLQSENINKLVWSTGLMAPEAYILHDAFGVYVKGQSSEKVREVAAGAYAKYQKCSLTAAKRLLISE